MRTIHVVALALVAVLVTPSARAQTKPAAQPDWRAGFDELYGLPDGQVLRHVPTPFAPERLKFYAHANAAQAEAILEGPTTMLVRWLDGEPRVGISHFSGDGGGWSVRKVIASVVALKPHEFHEDGRTPKDVLEMQLPGDWVVRADTPKADLLEALAAHLSAITARELRFVPEDVKVDAVVIRGQLRAPEKPDELAEIELPLDGIDYRSSSSSAGPPHVIVRGLAEATGWVVLEESNNLPRYVRWPGTAGVGDDDRPPGPMPREQLEQVMRAIADQTGLELRIEPREIKRWKLVERE